MSDPYLSVYTTYIRAKRRLKRLVRTIKQARRWLRGERRMTVHMSIATIPVEYLVNGNVDECFRDEETARMLTYTCWFMAIKWFMESNMGVGGR